MAFDGTNVWVENYYGTTNLTKIVASTGTVAGTINRSTSCGNPWGCSAGPVFDGTYLWLLEGPSSANEWVKILPSTMATTTYAAPGGPFNVGAAFDSSNIWVDNVGNSVSVLASDGSVLRTYTVGNGPIAMTFGGANMWVANSTDNTVTKIALATGVVGTYPVGNNPVSIASDGNNIWIVNQGDNTVTKLLAATGTLVGTYSTGKNPLRIAFDGTFVWVTNFDDNSVTRLLAATGTFVASYPGSAPYGILFDGAHLWVSNFYGDSVSWF
jgi:outer membrane lipoprotein-sorting protein